MLSAKFCVLITEGTRNTPLGIAGVILKELRSEHQIFIVEMGAYLPGDIKTLCDFVKPTIGILTAI